MALPQNEPLIGWQQGMATGIAAVDAEHQRLLRRLDELRRLIASNVDPATIRQRLRQFVIRLEQHIEGERLALPDNPAKAERDGDLVAVCNDVLGTLEGHPQANQELIWFLHHQLTCHIYHCVECANAPAESPRNRDLLVWSPIFSVGQPLLDAEHRVLVEHVNRLNDMLGEEISGHEVLDELMRFVDHARLHFSHESTMLHEIDEQERTDHLAEHDAMLNQVERLIANIQGDRERLTKRQLLDFVRDWVVHHILLMDMKIKYQQHRQKD